MQELGNISYGMDIDIKSGETAFKGINSQAKNTENQLKKFDTQVNKTAQSVKRGLTPNLGQAGIQVQQFVGQLQGGQSAMVALAQQSADLGIVLGAPMVGVIVSLGAVLLGTLLPSLMSSKTSADELEKSIEKVKAVMTLGAGGVVEYADQIKELNKVSEQLAKIKLAETIINQNEVIKNSSKSILESAENTSKFYKSTFEDLRSLTESVAADIGGNMDDVAEAIKSGQNIGTAGSYLNRDLDRISKMFKITRPEALKLGLAMSDVAKKGDAVSIKSLQNVTEDLAKTYGFSNEKLTKLSSGMVKYFIDTKQATDGVNELRMALFGKGQAIDEDVDSINNAKQSYESLNQQFEIERLALEQGARAAFEKSLQNQKLDETQRESLLSLYDYNEGLKQQSDSLKQTASDLEWYEQQLLALDRKEKQQTATLTTQVQSVGLTPEEQIQAQYERERDLLIEAQEKEVEIRGTYAERMEQIEAEKNARLKALREQEAKNSQSFLATYGNALSSINSLFGTYVNSMDKDTKKSFEKWKKYATAQALISTLLAVGNALASPAPWPIPLIMAGVAGAAGAMNVAQIKSQTYDGAREFGGPVTNGKSYLVGERGPEIFTPNVSGGITSNKDMMGGGGGMTVNVNNNTPYEVFVTKDEAANIANIQIGREAGNLAKGRGKMAGAMKQGAGTRFNATN